MIVLALKEFATKRRSTQKTLEASLRPYVQDAVDLGTNTHGWQELLRTVRRLYAETYSTESGQPRRHPDTRWTDKLLTTLQKTQNRDENSVERITTWLATAILSESTAHAAKDDPEELFLEWVDMHDSHVREAHAKANGQQRPIGEKFSVGGAKMEYPGDPSVEPSLWMNCRCTVRPVLASEVLVAAASEPKNTSTVVVGLPAEGHEVHGIGDEQKHITLAFLGEVADDPQPIHEAVARMAEGATPFTASVGGTARLGADKANVWLVEAQEIADLREGLLAEPAVGDPVSQADTFPHFVPHMTASYDPEPPEGMDSIQEIQFDRIALWHGDDQTEYALGGTVDPELDEIESPDLEDPAVDPGSDDLVAQVPWHGILAPEGVASGDGRRFLPESLSWRDLPLPLTWQKTSSEGHNGSVVIGKIEKIEMRDGLMRGSGHMIDNDESDELVGMIAEFGKFGVSVDADQTVMEMPDEDGEMEAETVDFSMARVCSASVVAIPAFAEAYIALGPWDDEDVTEPVEEPVAVPDETEESLAASAEFAPGTEDGPGWLTHPVDTDRLRDYWVRGAGAAKIGWGASGDFNRCRMNLAKYIKPNYLAGYCANRHKDALGVWPGQEAKAQDVLTATEKGDAVTLVAAAGHAFPASWFQNPNLDGPTHLTVTDDGRVYGHIAEWTACHIGFKEVCTAAPKSRTNYAYFLTGQVRLDDGTRARTGPITIGGGHADYRKGLRAATEHYDDVCVAVADVTVGEDEYGIWCSGGLRPGVTDEAVHALMASDVSGDWRAPRPGADLEMVAALAVNTGGFPTPRTALAASAEGQTSLVASGIIHQEKPKTDQTLERMAEAVVLAMEKRDAARAKMAALREKMKGN